MSVDTTRSVRRSQAACGIAVMAKASQPGKTKTRLVPPLSYDEAALFNTAFLKDISENLLLASASADIAGYFAYGPIGSEAFFHRSFSPGIGLFEAWLPNFGDCLFRSIEYLFARGHDAAIVLNSDSPTLPTSILVDAAAALAAPGDRAVLGPASDGGYYLIGLKRPHRRLFDGIDWSTDRVARQTMDRAAELSLPVHRLSTWYDIDDLHALRTVHAELNGHFSYDAGLIPHHAVHTQTLIDQLKISANLVERLHLSRSVA